MKPPIISLSALVSPLSVIDNTSSGLTIRSISNTSRKKIAQQGDSQSLKMIDSDPPPANSASPESASSGASSSFQAAKMDKKILGSRETPMSVLKVSPLSMFINNNKVGSSFPRSQQQALVNYNQHMQASMVLPVSARKVRDSGSLLFMLAFLGFLAYIIWDGIIVKEADINLIVHGHDSYGNICGRNNRPIKYVEKSGRNYTSKAYTKYTLINAQFERYTLDSDSFKHGELLYVKQGELLRSMEDGQGSKVSRRIGGVNQASSNVRGRRSVPSVLFAREQSHKKNQTLLSNLKSTLMYQYPPMYGYTPLGAPIGTSGGKNEQNTMVSYRDNGSSNHQDARLEMSASQTEHSFISAMSSPPTTTTPPSNRRTTTTTQLVIFDDHANDNDRYDHMFVTPTTSTILRGRTTPDVINQNEVSNQLLYLTECVESCPSDHVELIFYRCMPRNWRFSLFPNAINVTRTFIDDILTDVTHCYRELIYIFSFALVLSLALLILLRFLASVIIWSCLAMLITLFLSIASYSWFSYYHQMIDLNNLMPHGSNYSDKLATSDKWLVGSIFLTFIAFAAIGTVIFMRKRILLVTMLFRESGKAIADMPLLLLQPVLTFAALGLITALWSIGLICLQSMKMPVIDMNTGFVVFKAETLYKIMKWYHIFAFLWVSHFAIACQHYVIGASVSKWYFSTDRYNLHSPIGSSVSELILYYLGSVALGSFLVAIFKVIRIITRQIQYLVQRNCMSPPTNSNGIPSSPPNSVALNSPHLSSTCCGSFSYVWRLFIWFFDNIVMIINRDAYVEIAIHGHSFLAGAQQAFTVLASNPLKLLAIKSVGNVLLVVAKICVVFGTVSMAMLLLEEKTNQLNYSWSPIVISAMYAYIVAHWFLSVYEMVIDALFICYCEDYERSKNQEAIQITGSNFMSQILNNGNQIY